MKFIVPKPFLEVLAESSFTKLWAAQLLSEVSLYLINFVVTLRVYGRTGSSVAVGLVWFFYALPAVLLGPFSGTLVDHMSRKKLLVLTTALQACTVLLYLPIRKSLWPVYTAVFLYSLLNQIFFPAEAALIPSLVKKKLLAASSSIFVFTSYGSFLIGSALAGPLIQAFNGNSLFLLVSLLLAFASFIVSRLPNDTKTEKARKPLEFWESFTEGYEFIKKNPEVLFPLLLLVFAGIVLPILSILIPAVSVKIFRIPLVDASTLVIAPAGVGAICCGLLVVKLIEKMRKKVVVSSGIFLAAFTFFFVAFVIPHLPNRPLFGILSSLALGFSFSLTVIPAQTMLQQETPENLRGRVFGALGFLIAVATLLPVLFAATLTEFLGEIVMVSLLGVLMLAGGILAARSEEIFKFYYNRSHGNS